MSLKELREQVEEDGDSGKSKKSAAEKPNQYCLDPKHDPRLLTENRFFYWDPESTDCPVCPVCEKPVNAQLVPYNAKGQPVIPQKLIELSGRIGEAV